MVYGEVIKIKNDILNIKTNIEICIDMIRYKYKKHSLYNKAVCLQIS
jgi:hypothetical protein